MICDLCKGKGWVQGQEPDIPTACPACDGKGFVDMTNEEWFCGLSTGKKAKWFVDKASWIMGMNQSNNSEKLWVEWLKQPHRKE